MLLTQEWKLCCSPAELGLNKGELGRECQWVCTFVVLSASPIRSIHPWAAEFLFRTTTQHLRPAWVQQSKERLGRLPLNFKQQHTYSTYKLRYINWGEQSLRWLHIWLTNQLAIISISLWCTTWVTAYVCQPRWLNLQKNASVFAPPWWLVN